MVRQSGRKRRPLVGVLAYAAICVILGSVTWVAVTSVAARGHGATPSTIAAVPTATDTPDPTATPTQTPTDTPTPTEAPTDTPVPTPSPTQGPFTMDVYRPGTFISQVTTHACMAGAVQNMLNIIGPKIDLTTARQIQISHIINGNTTKEDSHNGGYGPAGWAITLTQLGAGHYKLIIDDSLDMAMHDAARALRATGRPVGLLSWWGAHSWVMTGFQTNRDPRSFPTNFVINGAYIVDPFYPRRSSIWGQTLAPDTFRDMAAMTHNYIAWKRPRSEGKYPGRDGKWLLVVPY